MSKRRITAHTGRQACLEPTAALAEEPIVGLVSTTFSSWPIVRAGTWFRKAASQKPGVYAGTLGLDVPLFAII